VTKKTESLVAEGTSMKQQDLAQTAMRKVQQAGHKLTAPRRATIEALAHAPDHLTAPQLVTFVAQRAPAVGRASVYRTLALMSRLGLVQASSLGGATTTYLLTLGGHHHHVICVNCRKTVAFDECVIKELERSLGEKLGFQIEGHLVELYGYCPACHKD